MIESRYRKSYEKWLIDPLLKRTWICNLHPQWVTVFGVILGMSTCPLLIIGCPLWALSSLLLSGFLDTLDGSLARHRKLISPFGAVCDIIADRVVELSVIVGLFSFDSATRGYLSLIMLGSVFLCVTSFLVVGIFSQNEGEKSFHYSPGLIERAEAFLFFSLMILFPSLFLFLSLLFSILVCWTTAKRMIEFSKHVPIRVSGKKIEFKKNF